MHEIKSFMFIEILIYWKGEVFFVAFSLRGAFRNVGISDRCFILNSLNYAGSSIWRVILEEMVEALENEPRNSFGNI